MRIVILGAGGIGGYLGARLVAAGESPCFLLRPARAARIAEQGLRLLSPLGDVTCHPQIVTQVQDRADLVILTCKGQDLDGALQAIAPAVGQGTAILPFLNGVAHLEAIRQRFPHADLLGGVAQIGVTMDQDGVIRHLGQDNRFWIGPLDGASPAAGQALCAALAGSPVQIAFRPAIRSDLWAKFVTIGTLAGVTSLCRSRIGLIQRQADGLATIRQLYGECRAIALAEHPALPPAALEDGLDHLTDPHCDAGSSLMRDLLSGRPTEHDPLLGDLMRRARRHHLQTPLLAACLTSLGAQSAQRLT